MEADFWLQRWAANQIGFHEDTYHPMLVACWDTLALDAHATVFVPLCGKSKDLLWLRDRGHPVIGVELSEIAVQAFFDENGIGYRRDETGPFVRYAGGGCTLLCGDLFALSPAITGPFQAVYDRASLIALPASMRRTYTEQLRTLCTANVHGLLITVHYPVDAFNPPPHDVPDSEVHELYSGWSEIELIGTGATEVKGVAGNESVFHWQTGLDR